jgi:two-component system phosphate regulon sensor histidine kinase PhoR
MPRTRLVWRLFAAWCSLVAAVLAGCYGLASLQLAGLADAALRQRLADAATQLVATLPPTGGPIDPAEFAAQARSRVGGPAIAVDLLARDGRLLASASGTAAAATGRFDPATGRRFLSVDVPLGGPPATAVVRATADATESDAGLARAQRHLLVGCLVCGAAAATAGLVLAHHAVQPVQELGRAAALLAAGEVDAPLPATDVTELAELAAAIAGLRTQLVERGLLIGRQGTQQEAVLGSMIEGVLAIDARQRIVGINRAAADLLGVNLENAVRRPLQEVVRNPDLRRFALIAIDCREPVEDDVVLRGDRDRTLRLRGTALRDVSGEGGAVIVLNDVTDVQRLENVRRDFVANVSHELKTPVASIKGFVETLLDGAADDPGDNRRFLEIVARQADRLASIIDDLLALSRIEQSEGAGNLPLEPTRLADILAAAVADCGPRAAERSVRLETTCAAGLVAEVNPPLLEQALINLVDNAIKYSEPGGSIWLAADGVGEALVVRVSDEGCGIEAEHLPRLFERFYRVDKARSRRLGGTGLGLAIVKHIVLAHGGTIGVESKPGVGTTFTIRLPAVAAVA